jgi:hypothetical protein
MHHIEPYFNWRGYYTAENDELSPFYEREYSEFEFSDTLYNFYVHPQWDNFGSSTLFIKLLFADYDNGYAVIEMLGEWNDLLNNDIMFLKRDVVDILIENGITKFILIAEHVMNFHYSDECYYEEWFDDIEDGWIALVNPADHVYAEMQRARIDHYVVMGGDLDIVEWRTMKPFHFFGKIRDIAERRLA